MTTPKNTPQDERDAEIIARQIEMLKEIKRDHTPVEINELAKRLKENNIKGVSVPAIFLCIQEARRGYVPNQTVVAIAEAAAKEERERCADLVSKMSKTHFSGHLVWDTDPNTLITEILNPGPKKE